MSKVDWSKAPEGAEFYARGFRQLLDGYEIPVVWTSAFWTDGGYTLEECKKFSDYEQKPKQWPDESRIDIIGTNGNTAEHYIEDNQCASRNLHKSCAKKCHETLAELAAKSKQAKPQNKYDREIIGKYGSGKCIIDVYRVLVAFGDIPPEIQHAVKKLLVGGKRGHKDEGLDYLEAIQSIEAYLNRLDDSSDQSKTV